MTDRVVVIVQARLSSRRLPRKVLARLGESTVLEEVLQRCQAIEGIAGVCCATVVGSEGDPIEEIADAAGAHTVRGPRDDVLRRYALAAAETDADIIVRVTSDCPLIDPFVCSDVLALFRRTDVGYACNNLKREWPHGLDCEIFSRDWLERADATAVEPFEREHVSPWIRTHPDIRRAHLNGPGPRLAGERWTLDYAEDLEFLQAVFARLPEGQRRWRYQAVLDVLELAPELRALNRMHGHVDGVGS